jgi:hypothetical protein
VADVSILMAALPTIHRDLGFSPTSPSWAQNAYTLTFGGLVLLGARGLARSCSGSLCSPSHRWQSDSPSRPRG